MKRQRRRTVVIFSPGSSLCPTISLDLWRFITVSKANTILNMSIFCLRTWLLHHSKQHLTIMQTVSSGDLHYKVVFPKRSKEWVAKATKQKTKRDHLQPVLDAIVKRKNQDAADRSATITAPHIPHNIVNTPRPDKAEVIARHTSRFSAY